MSMLEKMARQLAMDALNRIQVDTYTNVVDEIWLYRAGNATYRVSDYPGISNEGTPVLTFADACETMVAMMAEQAGALVVVPEDAPMDPYLAQIAQLLKQAADPTVTDLDVSDADRIVETVARMLRVKDSTASELSRQRGELREALARVQHSNADCAAASNQANNLQAALDLCREQLYAAQQEIGSLTAKLEEARRSIKRNVDEAANCQVRYEAMTEALSLAMDKLAGVGK